MSTEVTEVRGLEALDQIKTWLMGPPGKADDVRCLKAYLGQGGYVRVQFIANLDKLDTLLLIREIYTPGKEREGQCIGDKYLANLACYRPPNGSLVPYKRFLTGKFIVNDEVLCAALLYVLADNPNIPLVTSMLRLEVQKIFQAWYPQALPEPPVRVEQEGCVRALGKLSKWLSGAITVGEEMDGNNYVLWSS